METFIVTPKTKAEAKLLKDIFEKMKITAKMLSEEEKEDIGLAMMMKEVDRSSKVSRDTIMKTQKAS
jgi:hypothetical protein